MKRSALTLLFFLAGVLCVQAETIKLRNGKLLSGSILSQTEYTLNLSTSYGPITLNQKDIEQVLPDKHRIFLKGGSQLIGVILDLDEFNLKLQTADGAVNIDMPQIISVEVYDYEQGAEQKEYVEEKIEQEKSAQAQAASVEAGVAPAAAQTGGGLRFDSDVDKVFGAKKAQVVNGKVVTPESFSSPTASITEEEAFIKGVKTGAISQQDYATAAKAELAAKKPTPKKKVPNPYKEKDFDQYFAIELGAMPLNLKLDNSARPGYGEKENHGKKYDNIDVGGTSVVAGAKFMWRLGSSNFWVGPAVSIANISNNSFEDKDPNVQKANKDAAAANPPKETPYPDPKVKTSGQILNVGAAANYYINPQSRFAFYLTAMATYEMLTLNYRGEMQSDSISSNGLAVSAGVGMETKIDDLLLGLELRQAAASRSGELKNSASSNTVGVVRLSWKF